MKNNISIRAPRLSQYGGAGYVTADTLEVWINGERLKAWKNSDLFHALANLINAGNANAQNVHALIDSANLAF